MARISFKAAGLIGLLAAILGGIVWRILAGGGPVGATPPNNANDSPVTVRGGSLFARENLFRSWGTTSIDGITAYFPTSSKAGDNQTIYLENFEEVTGTKKISGGTGWVVTISDRKPDKTENPNAVQICSDDHCQGNALQPSGAIYIEALRSPAEWDTRRRFHSELHFHDESAPSVCDKSKADEIPICDTPVTVTVRVGTGTSQPFHCLRNAKDKATCIIGFGS